MGRPTDGFARQPGQSPRAGRRLVALYRGAAHVGLLAGPVHVALVRTWAWLGRGWWSCRWVGGALLLRAGPLAVSWWEGHR